MLWLRESTALEWVTAQMEKSWSSVSGGVEWPPDGRWIADGVVDGRGMELRWEICAGGDGARWGGLWRWRVRSGAPPSGEVDVDAAVAVRW